MARRVSVVLVFVAHVCAAGGHYGIFQFQVGAGYDCIGQQCITNALAPIDRVPRSAPPRLM